MKFLVPKWVLLCLILMVSSMFVYTVSSAMLNYSLIKPYVVGLAVENSQLTVESVQFTYEPASNRYSDCTVQVYNIYTSSLTGTVYVYLQDPEGSNIASGQSAITVNPGSTNTVNVPLNWIANKTVVDVAGGRIVIVQG